MATRAVSGTVTHTVTRVDSIGQPIGRGCTRVSFEVYSASARGDR
jgi:hypothetical protein